MKWSNADNEQKQRQALKNLLSGSGADDLSALDLAVAATNSNSIFHHKSDVLNSGMARSSEFKKMLANLNDIYSGLSGYLDSLQTVVNKYSLILSAPNNELLVTVGIAMKAINQMIEVFSSDVSSFNNPEFVSTSRKNLMDLSESLSASFSGVYHSGDAVLEPLNDVVDIFAKRFKALSDSINSTIKINHVGG